MVPAKLNILLALFAYGGNGGIAMLLPEIAIWLAKVVGEMKADPRIDRVEIMRFGDCPLTMERNRAVHSAQQRQCDVVVMIDSDNVPDLYLDKLPEAKPFWQSSFDFLYERKIRGLPTVVAAPYCGPPPHPIKGGSENVYVFHGEVMEGDVDQSRIKLTGYSREHAAQMRGIQPMAAGPTGCIVYDMAAFDLMPVHKFTTEQILTQFQTGQISLDRAKRLLTMQSWFAYEYTDGLQIEKATTDDVFSTREIQLAGLDKHHEPIVFCNWDAWAGHYKPKCVGKPFPIYVEQINDLYREAVERNVSGMSTIQEIDFTGNLGQEVAPQEDVTDALESISLSSEVEDTTPEALAPPQGLCWNKRIIDGQPVQCIGAEGGSQTPPCDLKAIKELVQLLANNRPTKPLRIIEVGSWVGESAIAMHAGFGPYGGTVFCVDTWEGSPTDMTGAVATQLGPDKLFEIFCQNVGDRLDKSIKVLRGDSLDWAEQLDDGQDADLIFIDAEHTYEACKADAKAWLRHVAPNGILAGHDFTVAFPGVMAAVKEICDEAGFTPRVVEGSTVWFFFKEEYDKALAAKHEKEAKRQQKRSKKKEADEDGRALLTAS